MEGKEAAATASAAESSSNAAAEKETAAADDDDSQAAGNEAAPASGETAPDDSAETPVEAASAPASASPEAAAAPPGGTTGTSRRVYVGNLAWSVTWHMLKDHVKSKGLEATRTDIMTGPDGRSKGCGIVEFATCEEAQQAVLSLHDSELAGRQIFVREDREQPRSTGRFSLDESAKNRRVYVGNLSWDVRWQQLKDKMREAGEVVHAEVITEHTGRSKGCGIVEYATAEEAQEAIATLTDTDLNGRMIFVREDRESSQAGAAGREKNNSVYVWNLSPETTWQQLKDHCRKAGNVASATIMMNAKGESIGCGVVVYQRPQEAARAIRELQGTQLHGVTICVREDRAHHQPAGGGGGGGRGGGGGTTGGRGHHHHHHHNQRRPHHHHGGGGQGRGGGAGASEGAQLFISNLSYETSWRELRDHFRQCGEVKRADVKTHPDGHPKGFGTVLFFNKADAEEAINRLDGSELQGRQLEVRMDHKKR